MRCVWRSRWIGLKCKIANVSLLLPGLAVVAVSVVVPSIPFFLLGNAFKEHGHANKLVCNGTTRRCEICSISIVQLSSMTLVGPSHLPQLVPSY